MVLDAKRLSAAIREKKNKMLSRDPELVDTDALIDVNPNDKMFMDMDARAENALGSPERMDARNTAAAESDHDAMTMGETTDEMKRMGRLKRLIDAMDL
jgi:hypothetical protein